LKAFRRVPSASVRVLRACSTTVKPNPTPEPAPPKPDEARADAEAAERAAPGPTERQGSGHGGLVLQSQDEENLPPLAFEPGVVGAAQKGVSAVVIAFGAAALGACAWGASQALFPSATSTESIFNDAFDLVKANGDVAHVLGTPLRAFGANHGNQSGRRNAKERWELTEGGAEVIVLRFHVSGPQGMGTVQAQVPANRRRGEFNYIIFENPRTRKMIHVLDMRAENAAKAAAAVAIPPAPKEAPKEASASA